MRARLYLVVILVLMLVPISAAAQQPSPISITVQVGLDGEGSFRSKYWIPVFVTLANDGPDQQIKLEWRDQSTGSFTQSYVLDLPGGARKQIVLPVIQTSRSAILTATASGVQVFRERIFLKQLPDDQIAIGLLSTDPTVLSSLTVADFGAMRGATIIPLTPALLVDDPLLLTAIDVIAVRELTAELRPEQREALITWVQQGGTLLIGGGAVGETVIRTFADVLPVTVGPLQGNWPVNALEQLVGLSGLSNSVPQLTAHTVTLRANAHALSNDTLISQMELGAGKIIFAAFDLATLRAWPGEAKLWAKVLALQPRLDIGATFRFGFNDLLQGSLNQPLFELPSTTTILGLISLYIIVIGPLHFFILRQLRRLEWAWLTTPLLIVIFLLGTYGMSFALRGTQTQIVQLTIVQTAAESETAITTTFAGIFSPQRSRYTLTVTDTAFVTPMRTEVGPVETQRDDNAVTIPDLQLDAAAFQTWIAEKVGPNPVQIGAQITREGQVWNGSVTNISKFPLRDVMVVWQNNMQWIGDLPPGAEATITLNPNQGNFLREFTPNDQNSLLNHTFVLENLFWYSQTTNRFIPPDELPSMPGTSLYLIGWSEQATSVFQIDGVATRTRGETLYIVALQQR